MIFRGGRRISTPRKGPPRALIAEARRHARARSSGFRVGAVAQDGDGGCHLGFNMEFGSFGLTVHAEQCAAVAAMESSPAPLRELWVDAAPCGHCRQFLLEFGDPVLHFGGKTRSLAELLPDAFGPVDLTGKPSPLTERRRELSPPSMDLETVARWAAAASHHPYTGVPSGLAAQLDDGSIVSAGVVESVAFNPTVTPLASLFIQLISEPQGVRALTRVVLCEGESPVHDATTQRRVLRRFAPSCTWRSVSP